MSWLSGVGAGPPLWEALVVLALSLPGIGLLVAYGPALLGDSLVDLLRGFGDGKPARGRRTRAAVPWITLVFAVLLLLFAWHARRVHVWSDQVREFAGQAGDDAVVIVDSESLPPERARGLLVLLGELRFLRAHTSHPVEYLPVTIRTEGRTLDLLVGRDSEYLREYWVLFPSNDPDVLPQEIGRISTDLLDEFRPAGGREAPDR
jgi:hypothetical protein